MNPDDSTHESDYFSGNGIDEDEDEEEEEKEMKEAKVIPNKKRKKVEEMEAEKVIPDKKRRKVTDDTTNIMPNKRKKLKSDLYKPPTVEELNQLRETENLFHSNLFRLQIEEMLSEIKIKDKYKRLFDSWFAKLETTVQSISETEEFEVCSFIGEQCNILEQCIFQIVILAFRYNIRKETERDRSNA